MQCPPTGLKFQLLYAFTQWSTELRQDTLRLRAHSEGSIKAIGEFEADVTWQGWAAVGGIGGVVAIKAVGGIEADCNQGSPCD